MDIGFSFLGGVTLRKNPILSKKVKLGDMDQSGIWLHIYTQQIAALILKHNNGMWHNNCTQWGRPLSLIFNVCNMR